MATKDTTIVIRTATAADEAALRKVAVLDGARQAPSGSVLVAEAGGQIRAAYGTDDGSYVADPFWYSAELVELMRIHSAAMSRPVTMQRSRFGRAGFRHGATAFAGSR